MTKFSQAKKQTLRKWEVVSANKVADLLLAWVSRDGGVITNLKLQKLLYYAQAWYLVNFDHRLFTDQIEAQESGPVIKTTDKKWKQYQNSLIVYIINGKEASFFSDNQLDFLTTFYGTYKHLSATALCSMVQAETPWKNAFAKGCNIRLSVMKRYYAAQYKRIVNKAPPDNEVADG